MHTHLTVEQSITRWLREEILTLQLRPLQPLGIVEIAHRFGASYTPVRGALARLETEGFVQSIPHRGSVVAPLTIDHADLVLTVAGALERRITLLGVPRLTDDDVRELDRLIVERERALAANAPTEEMVETANRVRALVANHVANVPMRQQYAAWSDHRRRYLRYCRQAISSAQNFMSLGITEFARRCRDRDADAAELVLRKLDVDITALLVSKLAEEPDASR